MRENYVKQGLIKAAINFWHENWRVVIGTVLLTKGINLFVTPKFL